MMEPRENVQTPVDPGRPPASTQALNQRLSDSIAACDADAIVCRLCGVCGAAIVYIAGSDVSECRHVLRTPDHAGIDMPGVGHVGRAPATVPGRAYEAGEVPEPLRSCLTRDARKEALFAELLFAGRDLAQHVVERIDARVDDGVVVTVFRCRECRRSCRSGAKLEHKRACRAARVFGIVEKLAGIGAEDLAQWVEQRPHESRERTTVLSDINCRACGERGGLYIAEATGVQARPELTRNQFAETGEDGSAVLYTHMCRTAGGAQ